MVVPISVFHTMPDSLSSAMPVLRMPSMYLNGKLAAQVFPDVVLPPSSPVRSVRRSE